MIFSLVIIASCSNNKPYSIFGQEQGNEEYEIALQLVREFSKEQSFGLSRNKSNELVIKKVEKSSVVCVDYITVSRSREEVNENIDIYTFTIEKNGKTGFAMATGDKRIAQVLSFVEVGSVSDTIDIPSLAFMIRNIPTALKRELREYYDGEPVLSRNDQNWTALSTTPFVKTTWGTGAPYNNNYDMVNCSSTSNYKYQASTTAVACAQVIIANKQRPTNFEYEICIPTWTREPKIDEKYNVYAAQAAAFIKGIDNGASVTYACERPSYAQLINAASSITYYGYIRDQHYSYDITADYAKIARNAKAGFGTIFGGKVTSISANNYYAWIVDGFQGKVNSDITQAKMAKVHCVFCFGGRGDGWFINPFDKGATGGSSVADGLMQFIYFNAF